MSGMTRLTSRSKRSKLVSVNGNNHRSAKHPRKAQQPPTNLDKHWHIIPGYLPVNQPT
jgi:hypothetical protein